MMLRRDFAAGVSWDISVALQLLEGRVSGHVIELSVGSPATLSSGASSSSQGVLLEVDLGDGGRYFGGLEPHFYALQARVELTNLVASVEDQLLAIEGFGLEYTAPTRAPFLF